MTPSTNRRHLLKLATAAASTLWLPRSAWSAGPFQQQPFHAGRGQRLAHARHPRAVDPAGADRPVREFDAWGRAGHGALGDRRTTRASRRIVQSGQAQALAELAHSVHVSRWRAGPGPLVLLPLHGGRRRQPGGRTRTFPAPDAPAARLRLAYASCQRWEHGYFSAWRHMRDEQPSMPCCSWATTSTSTPARLNAVRQPTGGWVLTLDDYRARYACTAASPNCRPCTQPAPGW
jgi:alkaline phosphatase D